MLPGAVTVLFMEIDRHDETEVEPHEFVAVTQRLPPLEPEVTLIDVLP
jgi:hypothetical protein